MQIYIDKNSLKDIIFDKLKKVFGEHDFVYEPNKDVIIAVVSPNRVKASLLDQMPNLKWIQLTTVGYNQIDLEDLRKRNICLTNAKDVYSITIAEDIITKLLVINRNVKKYIKQMSEGKWIAYDNEHELYNANIGFLGSGSLAVHANERLKAFKTFSMCYRQKQEKHPMFDETYYTKNGLISLLKKADYVINTLPLTDSTKHLLNKESLSYMKKDAVIINVGRGEVIDQQALIEALENHRIRGAALDVTTPEPLPKGSKLWYMDNVYITPHNAPSSPYMFNRLYKLVEENLIRYFKNESLLNIVKLQ
ncbi:MAG: D-2-hydroxyacid dehydrogenase [Acholeplasma sp.]|nr:D-2-hydroxyacid dehydrogenase [Acholeplasma sp.]